MKHSKQWVPCKMAKDPIPWFKFYPDKFMHGVRGLTAQEVGVYQMMLCRIYEENGPVEFNVLRLSTYCGMRKNTFQKTVEKLIELGKLSLENDLINAELAIEWKALEGKEPGRPPIPQDLIAYVYERDGNQCVYCDTLEGPFELDHVTPWSRGGDHEADNLVVSCRTCNRKKRDRTPIEMGWAWRRYEWAGHANWKEETVQ